MNISEHLFHTMLIPVQVALHLKPHQFVLLTCKGLSTFEIILVVHLLLAVQLLQHTHPHFLDQPVEQFSIPSFLVNYAVERFVDPE